MINKKVLSIIVINLIVFVITVFLYIININFDAKPEIHTIKTSSLENSNQEILDKLPIKVFDEEKISLTAQKELWRLVYNELNDEKDFNKITSFELFTNG